MKLKTFSVACPNGSTDKICDPIWQSIPLTSIKGKDCAILYALIPSFIDSPNLFSRNPVAI